MIAELGTPPLVTHTSSLLGTPAPWYRPPLPWKRLGMFGLVVCVCLLDGWADVGFWVDGSTVMATWYPSLQGLLTQVLVAHESLHIL